MYTVPIIETERLRLRGLTEADLEFQYSIWSDLRMTRFITGTAATREDVWQRYLRAVGHWVVSGFGYWHVEEKATGVPVGNVGFSDYHREMDPSLKGTLETGWLIVQAHQGKGYATESVRAILSWAEQNFPDKRITAMMDPAHQASYQVALDCGFKDIGTGIYKDEVVRLLERGSSI